MWQKKRAKRLISHKLHATCSWTQKAALIHCLSEIYFPIETLTLGPHQQLRCISRRCCPKTIVRIISGHGRDWDGAKQWRKSQFLDTHAQQIITVEKLHSKNLERTIQNACRVVFMYTESETKYPSPPNVTATYCQASIYRLRISSWKKEKSIQAQA